MQAVIKFYPMDLDSGVYENYVYLIKFLVIVNNVFDRVGFRYFFFYFLNHDASSSTAIVSITVMAAFFKKSNKRSWNPPRNARDGDF